MSDVFAPPPAPTTERAKPPLCGARGPSGDRCTLYREHRAAEHRDQHSNRSWAELPAPSTWSHRRKGEMTGHLIHLTDDGVWATIRLVGDQAHRTRFDIAGDGDEITVRAAFLSPALTPEEVMP